LFIVFQKLLPQHLLSRIVGLVANSQINWLKNLFIRTVVKRYQVDLTEAAESNISAYPSFNAFFTRSLKAGVRPVSGDICCPADGVISASGLIENGRILQAKGIHYTPQKLLGGDAADYQNGSFMTVYLSPKDYHRVHCPAAGDLVQARYIPGRLFSVNQQTTTGLQDLFTINERLVMEFDTGFGKMAVIMVGAMIVAAIQPVWRDQPFQARTLIEEVFSPPRTFAMGEELGRFQMGSTAIVLCQAQINWLRQSQEPVKMGEAIFTRD